MTARVQRRRCANATHTDPATAVQRTVQRTRVQNIFRTAVGHSCDTHATHGSEASFRPKNARCNTPQAPASAVRAVHPRSPRCCGNATGIMPPGCSKAASSNPPSNRRWPRRKESSILGPTAAAPTPSIRGSDGDVACGQRCEHAEQQHTTQQR